MARNGNTKWIMQRKLDKEATVIFDVGAYIGSTVNHYLRQFARAKVYAFEPAANALIKLRRAHGEY